MKSFDGSVFDSKTKTVFILIPLALAYWMLAVVADQLSLPGQVTAIWPASGLAAAAVIVFGFRIWPGILLGVYLNQMTWFYKGRESIAENGFFAELGQHSLIGLSFGIGNVLEALVIVWLVKKFIGTHNPLDKTSDVLRLLLLVPVIGPIVGALFGTLVICGIWQWSPWSAFVSTAWTWWISAFAGVLVVMPPLLWLNTGKRPETGQTLSQKLEFLLLVFCFSILLILSFWMSLPIEYLLLLILLWSAFRFGQVTTVWIGTLTAGFAVYATVSGYGPFVSNSNRELTVNQTLTLLQCFTSTLIITAGLLASVVSEWRRNQRDLAMTNASLEQRVDERTAELSIAKDIAEKANAAKSRFFAAASHDLRQPLHAMSFFVDALLMDAQKSTDDALTKTPESTVNHSSKERSTVIQQLRRTVDNMRDLFNGILDISRIDANVVSVDRSSFPLSDVLSQLDREYSVVATELQLGWHCDVTTTPVHTDPILLERILRNLLDNAIKFTPHGKVSVQANRLPDRVEIKITDTGVGISKSQRPAVFEEFYQVSEDRQRGDKGLGLGLSIVHRLSELLDIDLTLESSVPGGTTVTLVLAPGLTSSVDDSAHASDITYEHSLPFNNLAAENARILVIDDNETVVDATQTLLSRWGYDVRVATTEMDLTNCLDEQWQPHVAVIDYKLDSASGLNGLQMLDLLNSHTKCDTPALFISADTQPEFLKTMKDRNIQLLTKPLKPASLRGLIRATVRKNSKNDLS